MEQYSFSRYDDADQGVNCDVKCWVWDASAVIKANT